MSHVAEFVQSTMDLPKSMLERTERPPPLPKTTMPHTDVSHLVEKAKIPPSIHTNPRAYLDEFLAGIPPINTTLDAPSSKKPQLTLDEMRALQKVKISPVLDKLDRLSTPDEVSDKDTADYRLQKPNKWWKNMDEIVYRRLGSEIHRYFFAHLQETVNKSHLPLDELDPVLPQLDAKEFDSIHKYAKAELEDLISEHAHKLQEAILRRKNDIAHRKSEEQGNRVEMQAFVLPNFCLTDEVDNPRYIDGLIMYCPVRMAPLMTSLIREYSSSRKEGYHHACDSFLKKLTPTDLQQIEMEAFELKTFVKEDEEPSPLHSQDHVRQTQSYVNKLINKLAKDDPELRAILEKNVRGVLTNIFIPSVGPDHQVSYIGNTSLYVNDVVKRN